MGDDSYQNRSGEFLAMLLARPDLTPSTVNQKASHSSSMVQQVTPLWLAVLRGNVKAVQLLLSDSRTDPNIKNDESYVINFFDEEEYLSSCTPLSFAVYVNNVEIVKLLLSNSRTDPNIKDDGGNLRGGERKAEGNSSLMLAVKKNHVDCVKLLLDDPRVDLKTRDNNMPRLDEFYRFWSEEYRKEESAVQAVLEEGVCSEGSPFFQLRGQIWKQVVKPRIMQELELDFVKTNWGGLNLYEAASYAGRTRIPNSTDFYPQGHRLGHSTYFPKVREGPCLSPQELEELITKEEEKRGQQNFAVDLISASGAVFVQTQLKDLEKRMCRKRRRSPDSDFD